MKKNHLKKNLIVNTAAENGQKPSKYINNNASIMEGWNIDGNSAKVFVSLRFIQHDYQCFSDWKKKDIKMFWAFSDKVHDYTWEQVYKGGGKTDKTGLAYTVIPNKNYPDSHFRNSLDPQITLFEMRISGDKRVHGFRNKAIFYICWLDKNHDICSG